MSDADRRAYHLPRRSLWTIAAGAALLVAILSAVAGYWFAQRNAGPERSMGSSAANSERKVLYWYDPMVPNTHFDKPGKSPFMDMQLVPKYADEAQGAAGVRIDPAIVQNLGIRLTSVTRGSLAQPLNVVGSIVYDQRRIAVVQARTSGFVIRVYARAPGDVLKRGAALVDLLVPEWAGAQAEFLALLASGDRDLIEAARERLVLLGMPKELISAVEADRKPHTTITIRTPRSGAIESLEVREGMTITSGATLAKINGLDTMWLEAAIPEVQGARINVGQIVEARLSAYPGEAFKGKVIAVLPEANVETRTLRVRIELPNTDQRLRPGMFAQVRLSAGDERPALLVASEAVIRTGSRTVVIVAGDRGQFIPTEVQTGAEAGDKTIIISGLTEGQKVVASGQFLIDSEASLKGVLARLGTTQLSSIAAPDATKEAPHTREMKTRTSAPDAPSQDTALHEATGKVESLKGTHVVISHGPVRTLGWPAMTMSFALKDASLATAVKPGDTVHFRFRQASDGFVIEALEPREARP